MMLFPRKVQGQLIGTLLVILILVSFLRRLRWDEFVARVHEIHWSFAALCILMMALQIFLQAMRWDALVNVDTRRPRITHTYRLTFASVLANVTLVSSVSGALVRLVLTHERGLPWIRAICATVADRALSVLALVILCGMTLPFALYHYDTELFRSGAWGLGLLIACGITCMVILLVLMQIIYRRLRHHQTLVQGMIYTQRLLRARTATRVIGLSFLAQICFFIGVYFVLRGCGAVLNNMDLILVLPTIALIAALPISIGGWGVREGAFVIGLGTIGVPPEIALLASIQVGVYSLVTALIVGLPMLLNHDIQHAFGHALIKGQQTLRNFGQHKKCLSRS